MVSKSSEGKSTARPSGDKQFKGVRRRSWGKWVSEIRLPNTRDRLWLGSYATAEQAARAFDVAVLCLRGKAAVLNFPDSPPAYAPLGLPYHQIQELAAAAAQAYSASPIGEAGSDLKMPSGSLPAGSPPELSEELDPVTSEASQGAGTSETSAMKGATSELELSCCDEAQPSGNDVQPELLMKYDWAYEQLWPGNSTFDCWSTACCAEQLFPVDQYNANDDMFDPHGLWSL